MYRTFVSCVIDAPIEKVWSAIRPFDSLQAWHPYIAASTMEKALPNDKLGSIRRLDLRDGSGIVRETLLALSDLEHSIVYDIIESSMPVSNYIARIDLHEITEGDKTLAHWSVEFDTPENRRDEMIPKLQDIFRTGLLQLNKVLSQ